MKTLIHEIGVLDCQDNFHRVKLKEGLNIITGKSSTGKSAIIEIFDYCFASSENNIPKGVITRSAKLYYLCLQIKNLYFVLGREANSTKCFFKTENSNPSEKLNIDYFQSGYFLAISNYKDKLNEIFIGISDVDESIVSLAHRGKKLPTPSIRSFISLVLQHQNLIANKHAVFYRFDEQNKREQVISHMKIFLGLVDQKYYLLSQQKEKIEIAIKRLVRENDILHKNIEVKKHELESKLHGFYSAIGVDKNILPIEQIILDPIGSKIKLENIVANNTNHISNELNNYYYELIKRRDVEISLLRDLQIKKTIIKKTLNDKEKFYKNINNYPLLEEVSVAKVVCPFCHSESNNLTKKAEELREAINILSKDIHLSNAISSDLEVSLNKIKGEIKIKNNIINKLNNEILDIKSKNKELVDKIGFDEQILMKKVEVLFLLGLLVDSNLRGENDKIKYEIELEEIKKELKNYDVEKGLIEAESRINKIMKCIGSKFDFEPGYTPINLKFSLTDFDLYHQDKEKKRIYLRSMGSGANWLYCHITLFLALHRYFIELTHEGVNCSIPSVLFLDQPTQVYFPNFKLDNSNQFDKDTIKELERNPENFDEDIKSVENLFKQLALYCDELKREFGFSLQIIVTDHADNLDLGNNFKFEDFVNGNRWRTRGLIEPIPKLL